MLTYKATFKFVGDEVHAEVLDFPGVITCAPTLEEARRLLGSALADIAEVALANGEALPLADPTVTDKDADLEEPIQKLDRLRIGSDHVAQE
jgi:predicted RNase H-like HicB family nuclease